MFKTRVARVVGSGLSVGLLVVGTASCGKVADKASEKAAEKIAGDAVGGDVDIDPKTGEVKIKTDDGDFSFSGAEGKVPDDWPSDIPLPDDLKVEGGYSGQTPDGKSHTLTGTTKKSVDEVYDFYISKMSDWSKENESSYESDGKARIVNFKKGEGNLTITITDEDDGGDTNLMLQYLEFPESD